VKDCKRGQLWREFRTEEALKSKTLVATSTGGRQTKRNDNLPPDRSARAAHNAVRVKKVKPPRI